MPSQALIKWQTDSAERLDELLSAHERVGGTQDFFFSTEQRALLADTSVTLPWARRWQRACTGLTGTFDVVVADHVRAVTGARPW